MREHVGEHAMKTVTWGLMLIAAVMSAAAANFIPHASAATDPPSAADAALFDRLDANHDGQIVPREVSSTHQRLFTRLLRQADVNQNESLSREEFIASAGL